MGLTCKGPVMRWEVFLDVSIGHHPASTSDCLAFKTSPFHKKIETPGFLAPGSLCVFGDSADVNTTDFTPFQNAKCGVRDAFNFYQSQLRIKIECAFGMVVGRWGLLHRALSKAMKLNEPAALTLCLCHLQGQRLSRCSTGFGYNVKSCAWGNCLR
jgi:hypothetical protein